MEDNKNLFLLTVEFRYKDDPNFAPYKTLTDKTKKITIGVFEEAVVAISEGNNAIESLRNVGLMRPLVRAANDKLSLKEGPMGCKNFLVADFSNQNRIDVFVKIEELVVEESLSQSIKHVFEARQRYEVWRKKQNEDED